MSQEPEIGGAEGSLWVNGIVAARNHQPYIVISKGMEKVGQMSLSEARNFANDILVMASRTEADAMLLKFFDKQEYPSGAGAALMQEFRDYRAELDQNEDSAQ